MSFRWHPILYRIVAFGQVPAAVDWLLIRFLVDGNILKIRNDEETEAYRILHLATELDPAFFSLYTAGANFLTVVRNDRKGARDLLEKGRAFIREQLPRYPESFSETYWRERWRIGFILGYVYLFEFQDIGSAAAVYDEMRTIEGVPTIVRKMAERIQTPRGQFEIGLNALAAIRQWYEDDEVMQREVDRKVQMLELARDLYFWNEEFAAFRTRNPKQDLAPLFTSFRGSRNLPLKDRFGGEIYLRPDGRIDTRTEKVPVLGLKLDAPATNETPGIVKPPGNG